MFVSTINYYYYYYYYYLSLREVNTPNTYMIHQFLSSQIGRKRREKKEFWWYMVHACPQISPELHLMLHLHLPQDKTTKQWLWVKWVSNQNTNTTQNSMVLVVATTWERWFNGIGVGEMVVVVGESGGPGGKYKEPNNRNWEREEHEERTQINELSIFLIIGINDHD